MDHSLGDASVRYDTHGSVAVMTLNRPHAGNAVNRDVTVRLEEAVDRMEADNNIVLGDWCQTAFNLNRLGVPTYAQP